MERKGEGKGPIVPIFGSIARMAGGSPESLPNSVRSICFRACSMRPQTQMTSIRWEVARGYLDICS